MKSDDIIRKLEKTGAILEGHFLLTSGKHSNKYIEKFRILENPETLDLVSREMAELFKDKGAEVVLSAAIGGILLWALFSTVVLHTSPIKKYWNHGQK